MSLNKDLDIKEYNRTEQFLDEHPGRITGSITKPIELPVKFLITIPGMRGEHTQLHYDMPKIQKLSELVQEESFRKSNPIVLNILHDNSIIVEDGSHRIRAANLAGLKTYPAKIFFYGDSEKTFDLQSIFDQYLDEPKSNAEKLKSLIEKLTQNFSLDRKSYIFNKNMLKFALEFDNVGGNPGSMPDQSDQDYANQTMHGVDYGGEHDSNKNDNYVGGRKPAFNNQDDTKNSKSHTLVNVQSCFVEAESGSNEDMKNRLSEAQRADYEARYRNILSNKSLFATEKESPTEEATHLDNPVMHRVEDTEHLLQTLNDEKLMNTVHELEKETADDLGLPDQGITASETKEDDMTDKNKSDDKIKALLNLPKEERVQKAENLKALAALILAGEDEKDGVEWDKPAPDKEDKEEKTEDKKEVEASWDGSAEQDEAEAKKEADADEKKESKEDAKEEKSVEASFKDILSTIFASINELRSEIKEIKASSMDNSMGNSMGNVMDTSVGNTDTAIEGKNDEMHEAKVEKENLPACEVDAIVPMSATASEKEDDKAEDKKEDEPKDDKEEWSSEKTASLKNKFNELMKKKAAHDGGGSDLTDVGATVSPEYANSTPSEDKESKSDKADLPDAKKVGLDAEDAIVPQSPNEVQASLAHEIEKRTSRAFDLAYKLMQAGQLQKDVDFKNKIAEFATLDDTTFNTIHAFTTNNLKPIVAEENDKQDDKPDFLKENDTEDEKMDKKEDKKVEASSLIPLPKKVKKLSDGLSKTVVAGISDIATNKTSMITSGNNNLEDLRASLSKHFNKATEEHLIREASRHEKFRPQP